MVLKISLPSGRHREGSKINHFDKFLFSPSKGSHRETPKIAGWIIFFVPQGVEHETWAFMRFFRKYFVFGSKLAYLISCWKNEAPNWRRFSPVASKLMPLSGAGFLPWHQNWCHFDYLLTYSQWAKPFIKVFLKKPSKILLLRGNPVIAPSLTPCLKAILWPPHLFPVGKAFF